MFFASGFMPGWAELAAAADVGDDVNAAFFEPGDADAGAVPWHHRDFEAAIAVLPRGVIAVEFQVFTADLEVGDFGAVLGGGFKLLDFEAVGVEEGGEAFEFFALRGAGGSEVERGRREETSDVHEVVVAF